MFALPLGLFSKLFSVKFQCRVYSCNKQQIRYTGQPLTLMQPNQSHSQSNELQDLTGQTQNIQRHKHKQQADRQHKKQILKTLKNKLAQYQSLDHISAEELDQLCKTVSLDLSQNNQQSPETLSYNQVNSHSLQEIDLNCIDITDIQSKSCNTRLYFLKIKELLLLGLVILCIVGKGFITETGSYDVGDFTVFSTRYERDSTIKQLRSLLRNDQKLNMITKMIDSFEAENELIQIYLPKDTQLKKKKKNKQFSYLDCQKMYSLACLKQRLKAYGSMSLQLQEWILNQLAYDKQVLFQAHPFYTLAINLAARIIKEHSFSNKVQNKITVADLQQLNKFQLNSIKLSVINNNYSSQVQFAPPLSSPFTPAQYLSKFDYVFTTQQFFMEHIQNQHQSIFSIYPFTNFVILISQGYTQSFTHFVQTINNQYIEEIKFHSQEKGKHFQVNNIQIKIDHQMAQVIIRSAAKRPHSKHQNLTTDVNTQQAPKVKDYQKMELQPFSMKNHPCLNRFSYEPTGTQSPIEQHSYMNTLLDFNLLIPNGKIPIYQQLGSISPQILFFILNNLTPKDKVLFQAQFYHDDLILLTLAKQIKNSSQLYCIYPPSLARNIFLQNMKTNRIYHLINFAQMRVQEQKKMNKILSSIKFDFIFTTYRYFQRDYPLIVKDETAKVVIFYWVLQAQYLQFVKSLIQIHNVWSITQKSIKTSLQGLCQDYQLTPVQTFNLHLFSRKWFIVQI